MRRKRRRPPRLWALAGLAALVAVLLTAAAPAVAAPVYDIKATWGNTDLSPGGEGQFVIQARNVSEETGAKKITIADELPVGVKVKAIRWLVFGAPVPGTCHEETAPEAETATCVLPTTQVAKYAPGRGDRVGTGGEWSASPSGYLPTIEVDVEVGAGAAGTATNKAILYGGSGVLPGGSTCAQGKAELEALPPCAEDEDQVPFSATPSAFGLVPASFQADLFDREYPLGAPSRTAGDHPFELRFDFDLNGRTVMGREWMKVVSDAPVKTVEATLPRGMIGNPEALPKCDPVRFAEAGSTIDSTACPANTQVGYINVAFPGNGGKTGYFIPNAALSRVPIYSLIPPKGQVADFAFSGAGLVQAHIYPVLDPTQGYAIKTVVPDISAGVIVGGSETTFWGVPADPAHDVHRYYPEAKPAKDAEGHEIQLASGAPFEGAIRPLLTNPMDCGAENGAAKISLDSYLEPGNFTAPQEYGNPDEVSGCEDPRVRFEPQIALAPTDQHAGSPTGLEVQLEVPQQSEEAKREAKELYAENGFAAAIPTPPLKEAVVTLPEGMTLNPSAAQGLESCSLEQIGIELREGRFVPNDKPVKCPDASQYGTLTIHTPLLPENAPMHGYIYIAKQKENPFGNFLSLYLVIEEPERGILVKIPGRVDLNQTTGQITTSFEDLPQFPVSDMQMNLKGGVRAGLVNPTTCGTKTIRSEFFSWADPTTPIVKTAHYKITQKPDGSPCLSSLAERPFRPSLRAGTLNPLAGAFSPFLMRLTRTDGEQELSRLGVRLPAGLAAKFAGVAICPQAGIEQAEARKEAGEGALEQTDPSCPASSEVGTTEVGTGVGVPLTYVPGKVYLAGPYKGAPISIVVISPAVVGPFDLGVIAVRTALNVDPETAQGEALSDPLPQIFQGIPVRIRDIRLRLDREGFTLNPTSCAEKQIEAQITGTGGDLGSSADDTVSNLANRFQVADCAALGFHPSLSFRLSGGTRRGAHPRLRAVVRMPAGGANIARAQVTLPHSEFLDQGHIRTVCTRVQFKAHECPAASVYGWAKAITPLFDQPLEGPVYLRSSSHLLPDLVAALKGPASQPVEVDLDGRIDSVGGGIRNSFEVVPDAPVSEFTLSMQGGAKGLLVNSTNLCAKVNRATARFSAQNGRVLTLHPVMRSNCRGRGRRRKHR